MRESYLWFGLKTACIIMCVVRKVIMEECMCEQD